MPMFDGTNFYEGGCPGVGKLTKSLRENTLTDKPWLVALLTAVSARGTADGTVAALVTAVNTAITELNNATTFNKIVETY